MPATRTVIALAVALLSWSAVRLGAQSGVQDTTPRDTVPVVVTPDTSEIAPGDGVRITAPALGLQDWHGWYVGAPPDSVTVRGADSVERTIPLWEISEFLVNHGNQGPKAQTAIGAAAGTLAGGLAGWIIGAAQPYGGCPAEASDNGDCVAKADQYEAEGAIIGLLIGAGIGSLFHRTPWQYVPIVPPPEVALMHDHRGGAVLALRFRF